jgi:surfeit locus 1 family protein
LVPVKTPSGTVITNFGWVAATKSREVLPSILIDDLKASYAGIISLPLNNAMVKETALVDGNWPKVLQQTDLNVIQQHYKQKILPFVVLLKDQETSSFVRNWKPVVMAPEKHMAYAVQWYLLAIAALVIFIIAQRKKLKRNNK